MDTSSTNNLRDLIDWPKQVTIVPNSGIQMLDFGFNLADCKLVDEYVEVIPQSEEPFGENSTGIGELIQLTGDDEKDDQQLKSNNYKELSRYSINAKHAFSPFLGIWVPVPVLRIRKGLDKNGNLQYDNGPTTWARLRIVELEKECVKTGHSHRIQLALDTSIVKKNNEDVYLAPEVDDSKNAHEFQFVTAATTISWYLNTSPSGITDSGANINPKNWVTEWLKKIFQDFLVREKRNRKIDEDAQFEHWARYLSYIGMVDKLVAIPRLRMINNVSSRDEGPSVDVDLVLDIGNSRTCGLLVEKFPNDANMDLSQSYSLGIRDLSNPEFYNRGLIESRVEFAENLFGETQFVRTAGRRAAFIWPSIVRIGPEALRLVENEDGTEIASGLSSPKRYLWDDQSIHQDWRFHFHVDPNVPPRTARAAMQYLNEAGDFIDQVKYEEKERLRDRNKTSQNAAIRPRFSHSSMFCFMLAEIFAHVLVQINDPADRLRRKQTDLPRRLSRIILTLPTATPVHEQAIIKSRAESALQLTWKLMSESGIDIDYIEKPKIIVEWDEASCTQMVYLYNEIVKKFEGQFNHYLKLMGRPRKVASNTEEKQDTVRVCSIDIGGGTTDMMITTYHCIDGKMLVPVQNFREGFRIAGDDILKRIISKIIMKSLRQEIEDQGGKSVELNLNQLFGGDVGGQDQQIVQMRKHFTLRILTPLAIAILSKCEDQNSGSEFSIDVAEILSPQINSNLEKSSNNIDESEFNLEIPQTLIDYLEKPMTKIGATNWKLADSVLKFSREEVDAVIFETMHIALENLVELIDFHDCDVVLLSGRPSRLPVIRKIIENTFVVRSNRIISMSKYRVDLWYPYRDRITQQIGDPKSTVVVGGLILALAESRIPNFTVETGAIQMKSTARYIGELEINSQILNKRVIFTDETKEGESKVLNMFSPIYIGSRQIPLERWTTNCLYRLDFVNPDTVKGKIPIKLEIARRSTDEAKDEESLRAEALKEEFEIISAEDKEGMPFKEKGISIQMHTLGFNDTYWLDSGVVIDA